ncbi:MAG: hypothetical protein LBD79_04585 [Treponema sp.]|nr:hypothetical protein [Treponema sp.]
MIKDNGTSATVSGQTAALRAGEREGFPKYIDEPLIRVGTECNFFTIEYAVYGHTFTIRLLT